MLLIIIALTLRQHMHNAHKNKTERENSSFQCILIALMHFLYKSRMNTRLIPELME